MFYDKANLWISLVYAQIQLRVMISRYEELFNFNVITLYFLRAFLRETVVTRYNVILGINYFSKKLCF